MGRAEDARRLDVRPEERVKIIWLRLDRKDVLESLELPHENFYSSRSDNNHRAPGAVLIVRDQRFVQSMHPSSCCRPGGEAFLFIPCVLWTNDEHWCPLVSIRGSISIIWLRLDRSKSNRVH